MRALAIAAALALASCLTQRADVNIEAPAAKLEVTREKDADGHVVREQMVLVQKGLKPLAHGADKGFWANGSKRYEREFDHGAPKGVWRTWHANGQLASETTFGDTDSVLRFWYESGLVSAEGPARNGSRQGVWRFHRPDGSLREQGSYRDSLRDGAWTEYAPNGVETPVTYLRGVVIERGD